MKKFFKIYINLINKYILLKAGSILLLLFILVCFFTITSNSLEHYQNQKYKNILLEHNLITYSENLIDNNLQ